VRKSIYSREQRVLQKALRAMRIEADLRQVDLARKLGQPQSFVSKYENGERRLDLVELRAVSLALGTTLSELVARFERLLGARS
jgi:transcriptional regulator with XRE-family HTH domain